MDSNDREFLEALEKTKALSLETAIEDERRRAVKMSGGTFSAGLALLPPTVHRPSFDGSAGNATTVPKSASMPSFAGLYQESATEKNGLATAAKHAERGTVTGGLVMRRLDSGGCSARILGPQSAAVDAADGASDTVSYIARPRPVPRLRTDKRMDGPVLIVAPPAITLLSPRLRAGADHTASASASTRPLGRSSVHNSDQGAGSSTNSPSSEAVAASTGAVKPPYLPPSLPSPPANLVPTYESKSSTTHDERSVVAAAVAECPLLIDLQQSAVSRGSIGSLHVQDLYSFSLSTPLQPTAAVRQVPHMSLNPVAIAPFVTRAAVSATRYGRVDSAAAVAPSVLVPPVMLRRISKPSENLLDLSADVRRPSPDTYDLKVFDPLFSPDAKKCAFDAEVESIYNKMASRPQYVAEQRVATGFGSPPSGCDSVTGSVDEQRKEDVSGAEGGVLQDPFSFEELSLSLLIQTTKLHNTEIQGNDASLSASSERPLSLPQAELVSDSDTTVTPTTVPKAVLPKKNMNNQSSGRPEDTEEAKAFSYMVSKLKAEYPSDDPYTNLGIVLSPTIDIPKPDGFSVKVEVATHIKNQLIVFTCDVNAAVEAVIGNVLCLALDEQDDMQPDNYLLKVAGFSEYLVNDSALSEYKYVRQRIKLDEAIQFVLVDARKIERPFLRNVRDDGEAIYAINYDLHGDKSHKHSPYDLDVLIGTYLKQLETVQACIAKASGKDIKLQGLTQSVKAITSVLGETETLDIRNALQRLKKVASDIHSDKKEALLALDGLSKDVANLLLMYCKTFRVDYTLPPKLLELVAPKNKDIRDLTTFMENVIIHVGSAHRIPITVLNRFEQYKISCGLYYGGVRLSKEAATYPLMTARTSSVSEALYWDDWLALTDVPMCTLPRETRILFALLAFDPKLYQWLPLGWVGVTLFDHRGDLVQDQHLLSLWQGVPNPVGATGSNIWQPKSMLLQVTMPVFNWTIRFPEVAPRLLASPPPEPAPLPDDEKQKLLNLSEMDPSLLSKDQRELLWESRHHLRSVPDALPAVLQCVPCWNYAGIPHVAATLRGWAPLPPLSALRLLLPHFPSTEVRLEAVRWLRECTSDELCDYLPQLVQVLKFESYHDSPLARLLLERSVMSVRFAHCLYWTLLDAAALVPHHRERFTTMYGGLMSIVGHAVREELQMEDRLVKLLGVVAEKVKEARDKETVLGRELMSVCEELRGGCRRLPINPGMEASGLDVELCTYFNSFTTPLRLVFSNVDELAGSHYAMYKIGDDLRQDMLVMQVIRLMERLWQKNDLDLKMLTFECVPLGDKRGLVELITGCETLRKIQLQYGITGSFKDQPVSEWLKKHNPTELDYEKAVENFTLTCAGCCVATYVLGICDRHNDNIMVKNTGHMFHIDFSKFLGDAQMFGSFKRDRTPFVFTSDMAYVINGGDKPTEKFQQFIDLCCEAFNIVRRNANAILALVAAMPQCGIPGVTADGLAYIQKALLPGKTEWQATMMFTRMIEESLKSVFTQLNFFLHNLAQLKFFNHNDGELLSFTPKTYSLATDGQIKAIEIISYQKRYAPEKHYVYIIQVFREHQRDPALVFRRYSEFQEFYGKLMVLFPQARLPVLPGSIIMGRTHVQRVAERRKNELERFLRDLLRQSAEIAEHDLIYTFFHPMLRDEKEIDRSDLFKLKDTPSLRDSGRTVTGQVKLSLAYTDGILCVMVMHAKHLVNENGEPPHPYVKTYLLPDPVKTTKRKTKTVKSTFNPTYNEMLHYKMSLAELRHRTLQVSLWSDGVMRENSFLGQVNIHIDHLDLSKEIRRWYTLSGLPDRSEMSEDVIA